MRRSGMVAEEYWRSAAACLSADPDLFFPISASGRALEQVAEAKAICAPCPVRRQCLAFALRTKAHGIWGGMTDDERAAIQATAGHVEADNRRATSGSLTRPQQARTV